MSLELKLFISLLIYFLGKVQPNVFDPLELR